MPTPRIIFLFLFMAVITVFLSFPAQAQAPAPKMLVEDIVSQDTFFLATIPDIPGTKARFQNTSLAKFINDPDMQQAIQPILSFIAENEDAKAFLSEIEKAAGQPLANIMEVFNGQVAVAVDSIPVNGRPLRVLFTVDAGNKKDRLEIIIKKIAARLAQDTPAFKTESFKIGSLDAFTLDFGKETKINYVFINTSLVLTTEKAMLEEAVKNYLEKSTNVLSKSQNFIKTREKCGPNCDGMLYVNVDSILRIFGDQIPPKVMEIIDALGLKNVKFIAASNTLMPNGNFKADFYVHAPGEKKGIIKLAALANAPSEGLLKFCPKNAISVSVVNLSPKSAWDTLVTTAKAVTRDDESVNIDEFLTKSEMKLGFSIGNDFLASFGDQLMLYSVFPEGGGLFPDTICHVKLKNRSKFNECMSALITGSPLSSYLEQKSLAYKDTTINYFNSRLAQKAKESGTMFSPDMLMYGMGTEAMGMMMMSSYFFSAYYITKDDYLVLSNSTQALKRSLDRSAAAPVMPSILESDYFKKNVTTQHMNAGIFGYTDSNKIIAPYYNTLLPVGYILQVFIQASGVPLDMARFPTGETVAKYFSQDVFTYKCDNDGLWLESNGSLNLVTLGGGTAVVAIAAAVAIPSLLKSKSTANEFSAIGALKSISSSQAVWAMSDVDRNGINDYWVADVSGLYRVKDAGGAAVQYISASMASADANPVFETEGDASIVGPPLVAYPEPYSGYYFTVIALDENGNSYANDLDGGGGYYENQGSYAFCAYPAEYGTTGRYTFIVNESGLVYKQDTFGMPVTMWPGPDLFMAGWEPVD